MLDKGSFSFVALLVINPLLILFFQNCSFAPITQSDIAAARSVNSQKRMVSSVGMMDKATTGHKTHFRGILKSAKSAAPNCEGTKDVCPVSSHE